MPCTSCAQPYTKLRKEHGCSSCGYGFCAKCLSHKLVLPGISSSPVGVCASCYAALSQKNDKKVSTEKTRGKEEQYKTKNWWGDDKLPPPSMREQYAKAQKAQPSPSNPPPNAYEQSGRNMSNVEERLAQLKEGNGKLMSDMEERLAKLKDTDVDLVRNPHLLVTEKSNDPMADLTRPINQSVPRGGRNDPAIAQLEERLAALRGVPVDVIRKPRLMVTDEDDMEDEEEPLTEEAQQMLKHFEQQGQAPQRPPPPKRQVQAYDNKGWQKDEAESLSNAASTRTSDSSMVRKVIQEAEDTPSVRESVSSSQLYPNFEDCVRRVKRDVEQAEKEALDYINQSKQENAFISDDEEDNDGRDTTRPAAVQKSHSIQNQTSPKKKPGFLTRFFKSNSTHT